LAKALFARQRRNVPGGADELDAPVDPLAIPQADRHPSKYGPYQGTERRGSTASLRGTLFGTEGASPRRPERCPSKREGGFGRGP